MAGFRGVDQNEIVQSLNALFDILLARNIGPLTAKAIAEWRAPGGMLERISQAQDAAEIDNILKNEGRGKNDNTQFGRWTGSLYNNLLPMLYNNLVNTGRVEEARQLNSALQSVARWDGFDLLGKFIDKSAHSVSVVYPEDQELRTYCRDVLNCRDYEDYVKFNNGSLASPYRNYSAAYSAQVDFNRAAKALQELAVSVGMADHIGNIYAQGNSVNLYITQQLANTILERAGEIHDKNLVPAGMMQGSRFMPVVSKP